MHILSVGFSLTLLTFYSATAQQQPSIGGATIDRVPFTNRQFNDDTSKLQFAIISDLWGGNRPGIFEDAVDKLNLLQPQFVMSVGDLIDGKTHDTVLIGKQWNAFNKKVQFLSMPFFYVPGNHDIGNADMEKVWIKRFGQPYYCFIYKNALFLCVNTQDGGTTKIGEAQINYFKKAIAENQQVRWTFIFMHRPVWLSNNDNEEGYEKIEAALKGHNYTLFSGHLHTYQSNIKNRNKHFVLGSTGGDSELRGEKFGEFDHITLVTLNAGDSPKIINLKLNGIIKEDVVNEKTFPITNTLINEDWLITPTYVADHEHEKSISPEIIFTNPTSFPLKISGNISNGADYEINPEKIELTIPPHSKKEQPITITPKAQATIDVAALPFIDVSLTGTYQYDTVTYQLPANKHLIIEWQHKLPETTNAKAIISNQFKNSDSAGFISITNPFLQNKWYWYGTSDCFIRFNLMRDAKYLYIIAFIKDDQLVLEKTNQRDIVYIHLEDKNGVPTRITILPNAVKPAIQTSDKTALAIKDIQLKSAISENDFIKLLMQVPLDEIIKPDGSIRFNIGYRDQDNHPDIENATLFWKPVWGTETDYKNSGTYQLANNE